MPSGSAFLGHFPHHASDIIDDAFTSSGGMDGKILAVVDKNASAHCMI